MPTTNEPVFNVGKNKVSLSGMLNEIKAKIAQLEWKTALQLSTTVIKKQTQCAEVYYLRSIVYLRILDYKAAMKDAHKAIALEDLNVQFLAHRGLVHFHLESYEEAVLDYTNALKIAPNNSEVYVNRGLAQRNAEAALDDFGQAIQQNNQCTAAYNNRAVLFLHLKRFEEALKDFQKVIEFMPNDGFAHSQVGVALQASQQHQEALVYFDKGLKLSPNDTNIHSHKAYSLYRLGCTDAALSEFQLIFQCDARHVEGHYNYGVLLRSLHRYEESFEAFALAMQCEVERDQAIKKALINEKQVLRKQTQRLAQGAADVLGSMGELILTIGLDALKVSGMAAAWGADVSLPGAGIGVGVAVELICGVCEIGVIITQQVQLVQANKHQCRRLQERIVIICNEVMGLDTTRKTDHYILGLRKLEKTLKECQKLIEKFSHQRWFKRVLIAGTYNDEFGECFKELKDSIQLLHLGLVAQQVMNEEESKQDEAKDKAEIQEDIKKIIQLNLNLKASMGQLAESEEKHHEIVEQQLASMKLALSQILEHQNPRPLPNEFLGIPVIPFYRLRIKKCLGQGGLGTAYLGHLNGEDVVAKEITGLQTEQAKTQFLREAKIMNLVRSKWFVLFYGICHEEDRHYLLREYMPEGPLSEYLQKTLSLNQRVRLALDVAEGLRCLHKAGVAHRNLSSANVLIKHSGEAKLADFGLAKVDTAIAETVDSNVRRRSSALKVLAPEQLNCTHEIDYQKADIYSLGVLIWEVLTGRLAYENVNEKALMIKIISDEFEEIPEYLPQVCRDLITSCWSSSPEKRPTLSAIIKILKAQLALPALDKEDLNQQGVAFEKQRNYDGARRLYEEAMSAGSLSAQVNLGVLYCRTHGDWAPNYSYAYELFLGAAEQNHIRGMLNLAQLYEKGLGMDVDIEKAKGWLKKAADSGSKEASSRLSKLNNTVSSSTPAIGGVANIGLYGRQETRRMQHEKQAIPPRRTPP